MAFYYVTTGLTDQVFVNGLQTAFFKDVIEDTVICVL